MGVKERFLKWFRKFLLRQIYAECRWQARQNKLNELEFYTEARILGVSAALDSRDPRAKKTVREIINWYLYGMKYVRAYAHSRRGDRSGRAKENK